MITKDQLLNSSAVARYLNNQKGVLTSDEALVRSLTKKTLVCINNRDLKKFFFSDNHCFGYPILPKSWGSATCVFPMTVVARPGLEDGVIDTVEKFILVFEKDSTQITTFEELLDLVNNTELDTETSRQKHLKWCKERALKIVDSGDLNGAFSSMVSDLNKEDETRGHIAIQLGMKMLMTGHLNTSLKMIDFITGFN